MLIEYGVIVRDANLLAQRLLIVSGMLLLEEHFGARLVKCVPEHKVKDSYRNITVLV